MTQPIRVRFAPSPTGFLHVGNVRTALFNWLFARQSGGRFILRIEDTDAERSARTFEDQLLDDMRWLGLDWDEGVDVGGDYAPYRQMDRLATYRSYAERLLDAGIAYRCFCTPEELEAERQRQLGLKHIPKYSGRCREISPETANSRHAAGEYSVIRLRVRPGDVFFDDLVFGPIRVQSDTIGDFILSRNDGSPVYNFSCVADDLEMHISHVIRGEGHIPNTHRQVLIYEALGQPMPAFAHLSTIVGKDGEKLSKRHGATSVLEFRKMGYLPEAMLNYLSLLGWAPPGEGQEILTASQIVQFFSLDRVNRHQATFDPEKLNWVSRSHIKLAPIDRLLDWIGPFLAEAGVLPLEVSPEIRLWLGDVVNAVRQYLDRLDQIREQTALLFQYDPSRLGDEELREVREQPEAARVVLAFLDYCRENPIRSADAYKAAMLEVRARTGAKGRKLFHPIRLAVTGASSGLELESLIPLLETGSQLELPVPVLGCAARVTRFVEYHAMQHP